MSGQDRPVRAVSLSGVCARTDTAKSASGVAAANGLHEGEHSEAAGAGHPRGPTLAVAATVLAALAVYGVLTSWIDGPRAFADELLYFDVAGSIAERDGLRFRGEPYRYAPLYPAVLAGIQWIATDRETAYELAKALNVLLFALTAVPVFLLARRVLPPWPSAGAAELALAIPSATYASVVMTEPLAYLVSSWAFYAIVLALEKPSVLRQFAALLTITVAMGVRTQFIAVYGMYVAGLVLVAVMVPGRAGRTKTTVARLWPTVFFFVLGAIAFALASTMGSARGPLGDYAALWRSYDAREVVRWLVYHLANLELYLAVVPLAVAPIALTLLHARARGGSERHAAFMALFMAANALFLLQVAAFNSTEFAQGLFHDRPLFYVIPLWLILFLVWLVEGAPRPMVAAGFGAAIALALPLLLPYSRYVRDDLGQEFEVVPTVLWTTIDSLGTAGRGILVAFTLVLVLAAIVLPARLKLLLPAAVLFVFTLTAHLGWLSATSWSQIRAQAVSAPERMWLDERIPSHQSVVLLTTLSPCARFAHDAFYLTEFFNSSVARVAHLGQAPDQFPGRVSVSRNQVLVPSGSPLVADYVVTQPGVEVVGRRVAEGTRARLVLWRVGGQVRLLEAHPAIELQRLACRAAPR